MIRHKKVSQWGQHKLTVMHEKFLAVFVPALTNSRVNLQCTAQQVSLKNRKSLKVLLGGLEKHWNDGYQKIGVKVKHK